MPVDTTHPDYDRASRQWCIMRDVLEGPLAVKAKGAEYLPMLSGQQVEQYEAFKQRAQFFGITSKMLDSLIGFVFRKDPATTAPPKMDPVIADTTRTGISWYDYVKTTVEQVLGMGRSGTLIDFDGEIENRPYVVRYAAENIINWDVSRIRGKMMLSRVMLFEMDPLWIPTNPAEKRKGAPDKYASALYPQWREYELQLDEEGEPYVVCTLWRKVEGKKEPEFISVGQFIPIRRGQALHRIPFVFHNTQDALSSPGKVPLADMADVNLSHYRTSADYENACHMIGVPTVYVFGCDLPPGFKLALGTTTAITGPADAKCGFLEFAGTGMDTLLKNLDRKERQMASLGAKMLEPEAKKAEAYDTVAIRSAAETASLMGISLALSQSLSDVLQWVTWWMGSEADPEDLKDVGTVLNTEFVAGTLKPEQLTALSTAYVGNSLPIADYFWNLVKGEMVDPQRTLAEFTEALKAGPVGMPEFVPTAPGGQ